MSDTTADLDRLKAEYAARAQNLAGSNRYSLLNKANLFTIQQRQRAVVALLRQHGFGSLKARRILELGCGDGGVLLEFLAYGANRRAVTGADLLAERVQVSHDRLPGLGLSCADGQDLPYPSASFDLVLQFTVFSSILDGRVRANLAREMRRVAAKPGGLILWYDFWLNPTNPQTRGIRPAEIRRLFPACRFEFRRITLAPPLTRRLVGYSWTLCTLLEKLHVFNTHYLVAIRPL